MPPAMGQPINVVEKPSNTPGLARFEINRSLTGMGHERYASVDDILADRPVDELARRLFESGGVTQVHANGSMITVHLAEGWRGEQLLDVIRGLYIYYPVDGGDAAPAREDTSTTEDAPAAEGTSDATAAPEAVTESDTAVASSEVVTPPVDERVATPGDRGGAPAEGEGQD